MNGFVPTYCSKCGMRMVPPPNLCACQPAPAERVQQIIAERDRLREVNADLTVALENLSRWAAVVNDANHAGVKITGDSWSMLYRYTNEARAAIARATEVQS